MFGKSRGKDGYAPGITPRSIAAMVFCILMASAYTNYSCTFLAEHYQIVEAAIPFPAILAILFASLFTGLMALLTKRRLLTRPEFVCVAFATMISAPMMAEGFWQRFFGIITAPPHAQSFDYIDVYDDSLWPHGRNLLDGAFEDDYEGAVSAGRKEGAATNVTWSVVEYEEGESARCPTIANESAADETWLAYSFPVEPDDSSSAVPSHPHLFSVLGYIDDAEAESEVFCRAYADDNPVPETLLVSNLKPKRTLVHRKGFVRMGVYGVIPSRVCVSNLVVQIGYRGRGRVTFADPKLFSVYAVESCYRGRKMIDEKDWLSLPEAERPAGAVVRPSNLWSLRGLAFFVRGYIPLRDWARPAAIWSAFVLLLLGALFCVNVIMRRKWAESERYPMPNARIPLAIVGADDGEESPWASMWKNRFVWAGLLFGLAFGLLKGWHCYNPRVPDLTVDIPLGDYIKNPVFGAMFHVGFRFLLVICCIAVFFELNVLLSMVVGFWICRLIYFVGHVTGIDVNSGFPWRDQTAVGAYLGYFLVVLALSGRYLLGVLKDALHNRGRESGEVLSPRAAVVGLLLAHVGAAAWAAATNSPPLAVLTFFAFLAALGFVSAKFRAECGSPYGYFTPHSCLSFVMVVGGIPVFGEKGVFIALLLSGCFTVTTFYLIPGMQFELIETGHRLKINPRHIAITCLIGVLGGLFIGGWGFLTHGYADGGDNIRGAWLYNSWAWFTNSFRNPLAQATNAWLDGSEAAAASPWNARMMVFGGAAMAVLALLRQFFSGFWFHPIGFLLGWTNINNGAPWGTLLVAWAIRYAVLKIGGAKAVRSKLLPFFAGAFVGCLLSIAVFTAVNTRADLSGNPNFGIFIP